MKFIDIQKAKGLEINKPVFIIDQDTYGLGKLVKIEQTINGTVRTFEVAQFAPNGHPPSINPTLSTTVSHVAIIKNNAD